MRNRFSPKSQALSQKIKTDIKSVVLATDSQTALTGNPEIDRLITRLDAAFEEL